MGNLKLPPGFKAEVWTNGILAARGMRQGDQGTVFVSSPFVPGKIPAVTYRGGKREVRTVAELLFLPNGIEFHKGSLYVAMPKDITRCDNIEARPDNHPRRFLLALGMYGLTLVAVVAVKPNSLPASEKRPWAARRVAMLEVWPSLVLFAFVIGGLHRGFFPPPRPAAWTPALPSCRASCAAS